MENVIVNLSSFNDAKMDRSINNIAATLIMDKKNHDHVLYVFCACNPKAGVSTMTDHLAKALAHMGYNTVLVNCNLLEEDYRAPKQTGVAEYVLSGQGLRLFLTDCQRLAYLPCGEVAMGQSLEILCHARMASLFDELKASHDFVIIDTPDFKSASDGMFVASFCDRVILAVSSGETSFYDLERAKFTFEKNHIDILGVVLNKMDEK